MVTNEYEFIAPPVGTPVWPAEKQPEHSEEDLKKIQALAERLDSEPYRKLQPVNGRKDRRKAERAQARKDADSARAEIARRYPQSKGPAFWLEEARNGNPPQG